MTLVAALLGGGIALGACLIVSGLRRTEYAAQRVNVSTKRSVALTDLRISSPTRGATEMFEMGDRNPLGLYIPKGVAHGFCALANSFMTYLVDEYYDNSDELGVRFDDPALGIDWGVGTGPAPIVSAPTTIVRSFSSSKSFPSRPTRVWR